MTDDVQVKLGADYADMTSGTADAAASVQASLAKIADALQNFNTKNKSVGREVEQGNASMGRSFLVLKETIQGHLEGAVGVIERFRGAIGLLSGALVGGFLFKESVGQMLEMESAVRGLTIEFGMSAEEATKMATQLKLAGVSIETYEQMGQRVARVLRNQSEEFDRLGVKTKDSAGNLLPMDEILKNVYQRMLDFKPGTDQLEFALSTVGRNAKDFASDMERMSSVGEATTRVMRDLGIEMGQEQIGRIEAYRIQINEFKITLDTIGERIGEAVLPRLMSLASWFNDIGPQAAVVIVNAIKVVISALQLLGTVVSSVAIVATAGFSQIRTAAVGMNEAVVAGLREEGPWWMSVGRVALDTYHKIVGEGKVAQQSVVDDWKTTLDKLKVIWAQMDSAPSGAYDPRLDTGKPKNEHFTPKPKGGAGTDDRLSTFKDELNDMNLANGAFLQLSKQNEMEFWQEKLALVTGNGKEDIRLRQEINRIILADRNAMAQEELRIDVAKLQKEIDAAKNNKDEQISLAHARSELIKATLGEESVEYQRVLDEEIKLRQSWAQKEEALLKDLTKHRQEMATLEVQGEQQSLDQQVALRRISSEQKFAIEQELENKLYALKLQELQTELAGLQQGTLAYQQAAEKIEVLQAQHQQKLTQIANQAELDRKQYALQASQDVENAFGTFISDAVSGAKTLKAAMHDALTSIGNDLIKLGSQQLAKQLLGAGTQGGNAVSGFMDKLFGAGAINGGAAIGGKSADAAAEAAHTTAVTADTTATTTLNATNATLNTTSLTLQASFTSLVAAANSAAAALQAVGASGGLGGGLGGTGSMFDLSGGMIGVPGFAAGTPYVDQTGLAVVHRGEAIIPAQYNIGGSRSSSSNVRFNQNISFAGPVDTRSAQQIRTATLKSIRQAAGTR